MVHYWRKKTDSLRSFIELLEPYLTLRRRERIETVLDQRKRQTLMVLDSLLDVHNISAITRTCEGLGLTDLFIIPSIFEKNHHRRSVSRNTQDWLNVQTMQNPGFELNRLREMGYSLWVAHCDANSRNLFELPVPEKLVLIMGSEHDGPSSTVLELVDQTVRYPISGFTESFNVSVAAALFLSYILERQPWLPLSPEERLELTFQYYYHSVPFAERLLKASFPNLSGKNP